MKVFCSLICFLASGLSLFATELQPWLGNVYEFEFRSSFAYQGYQKLSCGSHLRKHSSDDLFLNASLLNTLQDPSLGIELEFRDASTRKHRGGGLDQWKITGRMLFLDDIIGDPISFATGLSYAQAFRHSLKDVSCFHHGLNNVECFASIGKEFPDDVIWQSRLFAVAALGIAEKGSPWVRLHLDWEKRWQDNHEASIYLHSLFGLGGKKLKPAHFRGFGSIQHQSIDLGLHYRYLIDFYGSASLSYSYRVFARNFPYGTHQALVQILYTFGL